MPVRSSHVAPRTRTWLDVAVALAMTFAYAGWVVARRHGDWADGLVPFRARSVFYSAPVVAPLVLFALERWRTRAAWTKVQLAIDAGVVLLAASRMVFPLPGVSGHALLLTYGYLTATTRLARVGMAIVLAATAVVKIFVWHDPSLLGGALVAALAARSWKRASTPVPPPTAGSP